MYVKIWIYNNIYISSLHYKNLVIWVKNDEKILFNLPGDVDKMIYNPHALNIFLGRIDEDNYLC